MTSVPDVWANVGGSQLTLARVEHHDYYEKDGQGGGRSFPPIFLLTQGKLPANTFHFCTKCFKGK